MKNIIWNCKPLPLYFSSIVVVRFSFGSIVLCALSEHGAFSTRLHSYMLRPFILCHGTKKTTHLLPPFRRFIHSTTNHTWAHTDT
jgi:hypothetical protein